MGKSIVAPVRQAEVIAGRMKGHSKRKIARDTRLARATVTRILSQEEVGEVVARTRSTMLNSAGKMAERYVKVALKGKIQHAAPLLKDAMTGLQVFQPKSHQSVTTIHKSEFDGRSPEELDWYARHGTLEREWPNAEEKAYFAQYGIWPQDAEG